MLDITFIPNMLRDLLSDQSNSTENQRTQSGSNTNQSEPKREDEEFVDINHEDAQTSQQSGADRHPAGGEDDGNWEDDHSEGDEEESGDRGSGFSSSISQFLGQRLMRKQTPTKRDSVHPFTSVLSLSNVEDCVKLENSACPEAERATREKVCMAPFLIASNLSPSPMSDCPEWQFQLRVDSKAIDWKSALCPCRLDLL